MPPIITKGGLGRKGEARMEVKSRYARAVLALLAGFLLFCAGGYWGQQTSPEPWRVTVQRLPETSGPEEAEPQEEAVRPDSLLPGEVIDVNTADEYDLQRLPGIGEKRARDIVAWREAHGPFQTVDELEQVSGIGPATVAGLREYASAGPD